MTAGVYDILIEQGASWYRPFRRWEADGTTPISVIGYVARMKIRQSYTSSVVQVSLTSDPGGGIVLSDTNLIEVTMTAEQTAAINIARGVWDLELEAPDGWVIRLLQGKVTVSPEVTK